MRITRPFVLLALAALLAPRVEASRTSVWESNPPSALTTTKTDAAGLLASLAPAGPLESTAANVDLAESSRFDLGHVVLVERELEHEERFHLGPLILVDLNLLRGPPSSYPETRVRGFELLPPFRVGASASLSLWGRQACGFSCREVVSDSRYDPWGLAVGDWWDPRTYLPGDWSTRDEQTTRKLIEQRAREADRLTAGPSMRGPYSERELRQAKIQTEAITDNNRDAMKPVFWTVHVPNTVTALAAPAVGAFARSQQRASAASAESRLGSRVAPAGVFGTKGAGPSASIFSDLPSQTLFGEFGVNPGVGVRTDVVSGAGGRSYITYGFRDASGKIVYVGRAGGPGTPDQVLMQRIGKGHDHFRPGDSAQVLSTHGTREASQGAEEFFLQGYLEMGAELRNKEEAVSFINRARAQKSLSKLDAFFEELGESGGER